MNQRKRNFNEGYLNNVLQEWILEILNKIVPDEDVNILSLDLHIRTKENPVGYNVDILGVDEQTNYVEVSKIGDDRKSEGRRMIRMYRSNTEEYEYYEPYEGEPTKIMKISEDNPL